MFAKWSFHRENGKNNTSERFIYFVSFVYYCVLPHRFLRSCGAQVVSHIALFVCIRAFVSVMFHFWKNSCDYAQNVYMISTNRHPRQRKRTEQASGRASERNTPTTSCTQQKARNIKRKAHKQAIACQTSAR